MVERSVGRRVLLLVDESAETMDEPAAEMSAASKVSCLVVWMADQWVTEMEMQ